MELHSHSHLSCTLSSSLECDAAGSRKVVNYCNSVLVFCLDQLTDEY